MGGAKIAPGSFLHQGSNAAFMLQEIVLLVIVLAGSVSVTRLWQRHKVASVLVCLAVALTVVWLARRWHIDLSGVS